MPTLLTVRLTLLALAALLVSDSRVKLIDVYAGDFPDPNPNPAGVRMGGYQQLVRGDVFR